MKKRSDFTLVELALVIVCFVGLLVVINGCELALPAMQRARESAKQSSCKANLKQIGTALRMYANDHNGYLPNGPAPTWVGDEFYGESDFYGRGRSGGYELLRINGYLCDYAVYVCPSSSVDCGKGTDSLSWSNEGSGSDRANLSYAYHAGLVDDIRTETGLAGSAVAADLTGDAGVDSNKGWSNHTKYGNILFLDGHVEGFAGAGWFSPENTGYPCYGYYERNAAMTPNTLRDPRTGEQLY